MIDLHIKELVTRLGIATIAIECDLISTHLILGYSSKFYETRPWGYNPVCYFGLVLVSMLMIFGAELYCYRFQDTPHSLIKQHTLSLCYAFVPFYGAFYNIIFFVLNK